MGVSRVTMALLIVAVLGPAGTGAAPPAPATNVVLSHGAFADGSSWSKVIPLLLAKKLRVTAVGIPLTSFADDVAATRRAIAAQDGPTVLVGHSYGGCLRGAFADWGNIVGASVTMMIALGLFEGEDEIWCISPRAIQPSTGSPSRRHVRAPTPKADVFSVDLGPRTGENVIVSGLQYVRPGISVAVKASVPAPAAPTVAGEARP
jgi:pimeloyl-ACP methyl ester carboxylesterase